MNLRPFIVLASMISIVTSGFSQTDMPDTAVFSRITAAEMNGSQVPMIAHYLTDVAGPRLTGSAGYTRAAQWAVKTMQGWGLTNAKMEPWGEFGKSWDLEEFSLSMTVPYYAALRAHPTPWTSNSDGPVKGEVLLIDGQNFWDTAYLKSHAADFRGKFLLMTGKTEPSEQRFEPSAMRLADTTLAKMSDQYMFTREEFESQFKYFDIMKAQNRILKETGMLSVLMATPANVDGTVFAQTFGGYKTTDPERPIQVNLSMEDGLKLRRIIESGEKLELTLNVRAKSGVADTKGYNVVAEIPGTDPKLKSQLVMLGGHLDSWASATGATDNAAGCIVMMEAVRLLDSLGLKPKRTIRIVLWGGEEQGLLGSYGYVLNHFMDTVKGTIRPEQAKVSAYYNIDNGTGKIRGIYSQNNSGVEPIFTEWFKPFADLDAKTVTHVNTGSTDHIAFDWAGIPGFQFIQDPIDYETRTHHSNLDDYDHLMIDDLKQAAIIVASFVYQTSVRAEMMPRKPFKKETFVFDGM